MFQGTALRSSESTRSERALAAAILLAGRFLNAGTGGPAALMIRRETARGPLPFHIAAARFLGLAGP